MTSCRGLILLSVGLALFGPPQMLLADAPATPSTPPTPQQIYNEAQAAFDKSDWPAAITGFSLIAGSGEGGEVSRSQGIIHARLAQAYAHERAIEDADREAAIALKGLGPHEDIERAMMWLAIGEAQRFALAMPAAIEAYDKGLGAAQQAKSAELVARAEIGLALCYMTVDPAKAAALMDTVLASPEASSYAKPLHAQYYGLRGRATLNLGQAREAMPFLTKAIELSGGIGGTQVNLIQIGIRGDAAIGALLSDHADKAREYLAWTGAGHLESEEWTHGFGSPPHCSEAADIRPDDVVVIEFSIAADGHVMGAAPIYASRPGTLGIAFAKAVKEWRWNPDEIATLPSFWRNMVRVELRCDSRPSTRGLSDPFYRETLAWLAGKQLSREDLAPLRKGYVAGNDPRLEHDDVAAIPALLTRLPIETDHKKVVTLASLLTTALDKAGAPAAARALAMMLKPEDPSSNSTAGRVRTRARELATLEQTDPGSAATAWISLEYALALEADGRLKDARPILERVLAYPSDVVGEHDPVRDVAILHLALLQRRAGDAAGADTKVKAAGLTPAQCMLFDVRPVVANNTVYSGDFPREALRWGFDGYVRETFNIAADGHVENIRTLIAYPPFVFRSGAERTVAHFRYLAPVIDGVSAGCDGHSLIVRYKTHP